MKPLDFNLGKKVKAYKFVRKTLIGFFIILVFLKN